MAKKNAGNKRSYRYVLRRQNNTECKKRKRFVFILLLVLSIMFVNIYKCLDITISQISFSKISLVEPVRFWVESFFSGVSHYDVSCTFEHIYSQDIQNKIKALIAQKTRNANPLYFRVSNFSLDLKTSFNVIDQVSIQRGVPNKLNVKIIGVRPVYLINTRFIVGENRRCYDNAKFKGYDVSQLKHACIAHEYCKGILAQDVYVFLSDLPEIIWDKFILDYHRPTHVALHPRKEEHDLHNCEIVADNKIKNYEKIKNIEHVCRDMFAKDEVLYKRWKLGWRKLTFDVRFDNRIVVKIFKLSKRRGRGT